MKTIEKQAFENLSLEVQTICSAEAQKYNMPGEGEEDTYTGLTLTSTVFI